MEYQKIINILDNTTDKPSKFKTKNWGLVKDDASGNYGVDTEIKFMTTMLKSSLCDYSEAYILVWGIIVAVGKGADDAAIAADRSNKK